jgi:hypothetical protein
MTILESLQKIQSKLHVKKEQKNTFGKYNYRSCEDILEAVKPLLEANSCILTLSDEMIEVGGRVYVKATAQISDTTVETIAGAFAVTACAREAETQKGMADAQITGAASSYARKYALNGLFAIDDTKDDDATNDHKEKPVAKKPPNIVQVMEALNKCTDEKSLDICYGAATKYEFSLADSDKIVECKQNILSRLTSE